MAGPEWVCLASQGSSHCCPMQYLPSRDHNYSRARVHPLLEVLLDKLETHPFTVLLVELFHCHCCFDTGLQFDVHFDVHMYIWHLLFVLLKIDLQLIHPLLICYLNLNREVLVIPVAVYSAQLIVWRHFPSLITKANCFITARIALALLTKEGHYPWLQQLLEQMMRPLVCIT